MKKTLFRGVSLIEMALVLAIIGLTLGVYFSRSQTIAAEQRWEDAERELAAIREAVVLYAAKNKTAQRRVEVRSTDGAGALVSEDVIPAGRPILPCPDVNGDGVEDRQNEGAMPPADQALTIIISRATPARLTEAENAVMRHGNCVMQKGALPWRSLAGVFRETDPWGNQYTYRVDSNFSNRIIGFDQYSRADSYDTRQPWTASGDEIRPWPIKRAIARADMPVRMWTPYRGESLVVLRHPIRVNERPSIVCQRAPCPPRINEANEIVAGMLATTAITVIVARQFVEGAPPARVVRTFNPPASILEEVEIAEGLPFVVISHGREDRGARLPPRKSPGGLRGVYMARDFDPWRASDINNAMDFGLGQIPASQGGVDFDPMLRTGGFAVEDLQIDGPARDWAARFRTPLMDNGFVQPRGVRVVDHRQEEETAQPVHDDVVTWMTTEELIQGAYRLKFLPARPLPPFGVGQ